MLDIDCDYCGEYGHGWDRHPEAVADVMRWEQEQAATDNREVIVRAERRYL